MPQLNSQQLRDCLYEAFEADHWATVIVLARKILEDSPDHAHTWIRLGHALTCLANYDKAEHALNKTLEFWSESRREIPFIKMGHLFKDQGIYETATEWYRKAIDSKPHDATGYIFLGGVLAEQGKLSEAESTHRAATQCTDGSIDEAFHNLGLVLRAQGQIEEARVCFTKALELDPEYENAQEALDDVVKAISYGRNV